MSRQNPNDDHSELEAELRRGRPAPRPTFLQSLSARIEDVVGHAESPSYRARPSRPRFRFGLAVAFATVFLAVFASFGGLGYANSSVRALGHRGPSFVSHLIHGHTPYNTSHTASKSEKHGGDNGDDDDGDDDDNDSAEHQYPHFVAVCLIKKHKEIRIVVPEKVANKLIAKGKAHVPPCVTNSDDDD